MKLLSFVFLLLTLVCNAQTPSQYHVVRVVGTVESPALKRALKTGDVIQSKDQLKFGNRTSYIIVNSPQTGRKRISGVPDSTPREFLQLLQSFVQPELKSTASRGISLQYIEQLQGTLSADTILVLGDGAVAVNTAKLPLAKPAAIKAWHYDAQKKPKYIKISSTTGFKLNKQTLFGDDAISRVIVEYFENESDDPVFNPGILLGAFVPRYVNEQELAPEIRALVAGIDKTKTKNVIAEINSYLRQEYAFAQEDNLKTWLKDQKIVE